MEACEERACPASLSLGPSGLHVAEGGTATEQVTISQPQMWPTQFTFRTVAGTATGGADYTEIVSGSGTIPPGASFANIQIQALHDFLLESEETFTLELVTATGATINPAASSQVVTIDNVQSGGGGGSSGSLTASLSVPANVNEGQVFTLTGTINAGGNYYVTGTVDWGITAGEGTTSFAVYTNPSGTFTIPHRYLDDGPDPGNGTPNDVQAITITGTATPTMPGGSSLSVTGSTSTTIHNVAPTPAIDIYNYMPIGGPWWKVHGVFHDVGLTDKGTITIDWGDGSDAVVYSNVPNGYEFDPMAHRYPGDGLGYTITVTVTDDDTAVVVTTKNIGLYLLDLDNDTNNNGEIAADDEELEPNGTEGNEMPTGGMPGRYIAVNGDDDNNNGIADMFDAGPVSGENDLEPFEVKWQAAVRPDINDYAGWHITLNVWPHDIDTVPEEYSRDPIIWTTPNKSGSPVDLVYHNSPIGDCAATWTVGGPAPQIAGDRSASELSKTFYVEARQAGSIYMKLRLWSPGWQVVESDAIVFTALVVDADINMEIGHGRTYRMVDDDIKWSQGAFTVANLNDSDGDNIIDFNDQNVQNTIEGKGWREVDLMPLVIDRPNPYDPAKHLTLNVSGAVSFWTESTKQTAVDMDSYLNTWVNDELSKTVWVEATAPSATIRDIRLELRYPGAVPDSVRATAVWATKTAVEHNKLSAAAIFEAYPSLKDTSPASPNSSISTLISKINATGLQLPEGMVQNGILFQFTMTPRGINKYRGLVNFDISRRADVSYTTTDSLGLTMDPAGNKEFTFHFWFPTSHPDAANDDGSWQDESSFADSKDQMYSFDAPGLPNRIQYPGYLEVISSRTYLGRFDEFVRATIDTFPGDHANYGEMNAFLGTQEEAVDGSRASDFVPWSVVHTLTSDGTKLVRTTGDDQETVDNYVRETY
ncbi:MAG: Calx-beta domain-containing protein [Pirellulaceae bacterium]